MKEKTTLTLDDCKITLESAFHLMRTLPRERLLNAMLQVTLRYFDVVCIAGTDSTTKQVLAIYEVAELLRADNDFFAEIKTDESATSQEVTLQ